MKKIAAMADAHYVTFAPHNPNDPVYTAASLHVAASSPNFLIMEEGNTRVEEYNDIFAGGWKPTLAAWKVPESAGLGADLARISDGAPCCGIFMSAGPAGELRRRSSAQRRYVHSMQSKMRCLQLRHIGIWYG